VRHHANLWLKNTRKSAEDLAAAAGLDASRLNIWLGDAKMQLDIEEHARLMPVIGLKKGELPEILVHDFRENGYLPQVLLNFLVLLGWSPGGDRERMTIPEMIELFSLERVGVANPKFSREKLVAFNTEAGASLPIERLVAAFRDYLSVNPESPVNRASDEQLVKLIQMKKGFRTLREVDEPARFLFVEDDQIAYDPQAVEKVLTRNDHEGIRILREIHEVLAGVNDWTHGAIESAVKDYCEQKQLGLGKVAQPIRVAVTGGTISPPIFESLEFLGRERTLRRVERCISAAG
jgi:glutamyl-tRNA synthetase